MAARKHTGSVARRAAAMAVASFLVLFAVGAIAASPEVAEISEPAEGAAPLSAEDVHMVAVFGDVDGDAHVCSDWEIWSVVPPEPVWQAPCATGQEAVHIHLGDGEFVNSHVGRSSLLPDAAYELRVRFRDDSGDEEEEWSQWETRVFTTRPAGPVGAESSGWIARQGFVVETFAEDLQLPVNIAMVPQPGPHPGDPFMYVAELYGSVKAITRDGTVHDYATDLLNFNPTGNFPGSGEMGLAGIAVDPLSGDLFVSLVYEGGGSPELPPPHYPRVLRLHSDGRGLQATGGTTVLDMDSDAQGASHQVSNVSISPTGELFVHNGDGGKPQMARSLDSFLGKILRLGLDGEPLADNPHYTDDGEDTAPDYVYASGLRNPFGGAWRLSDGSHYSVENGPITDRLAKIEPGADYLWAGFDSTMTHLASYNWFPSHAPVNIEFVEPQRFGGSGFPAASMGHAFVTESGPTYASGPQANGKRIVEFDLGEAGELVSGPTTLVEYGGTGKATAVGLAAGSDGLYFTDLYKDRDFTSPIDSGAKVLRVRYCGALCTTSPPAASGGAGPEQAGPADTTPPSLSGFRLRHRRLLLPPRRLLRSRQQQGSAFLYALSEPAKVRISIFALKAGRHHPRGAIAAPGASGQNRKPFSGYVGGRRLPAGRYLARIRAEDAAGNASHRTAAFSVVEAQ